MTIEIHKPELEALLQQRMQSGRFRNLEEVILQALEAAPLDPGGDSEAPGAEFIAAMRASPHKDVEIELSPMKGNFNDSVAF